ncbi:hypothetical protein vseg_002448 [Gypsophila vaccaria]
MEGTKVNEVKLSLKIMVDSKAKKVLFAEAGKDFVDFLFHLLSLPLATVVKLLSTGDKEMTGSLTGLYKSVEPLSTKYLKQNVNKDTILMPKLPITLPLLSLKHTPATISHYKCPNHNYGSCRSGAICPTSEYLNYQTVQCKKPLQEVKLIYVAPENELPEFANEAVPYMVMDNLEVKPMSMTLIMSLVTDFNNLVDEDVQFGPKEALTLLRASLTTKNVLTTVFLGVKKEAL